MTTKLPPAEAPHSDVDISSPWTTDAAAGSGRRWLIALTVLAALVLIGATVIAVLVFRQPADPAGPPPASVQPQIQSSTAPSAAPSSNGTTTSPTETALTPAESVELSTNARSFVSEVVGMVHPAGGQARLTAKGTATVDFRATAEDGSPIPGPPTVVVFNRYGASWMVVGTLCDAIRVSAPSTGQTITTPLAVSGQAVAYEGTVVVRILEPAGGRLVEVGRGVVTGGGMQLAPFHGQIAFRQPGGGMGWVVFHEESAVNGQVIRATTVTIQYPVRS
jgi:hypothetical protein